MASEKTFDDLLSAAPKVESNALAALVGTLARTDDADRFVLRTPEGAVLTLARAAVKSHAVIGEAGGQPVVRIEVAREDLEQGEGGSAQPFSLATGHHLSPAAVAALGPQTGAGTPPTYDCPPAAFSPSGTLGDVGTVPSYDSYNPVVGFSPSGTLGDVGTVPSYDSYNPAVGFSPSGTLGDVGTVPSYDSYNPVVGFSPSGTLGDVGTVPSYDSYNPVTNPGG